MDVLQSKHEVQNANILRQNSRNRRLGAWQTLASVVGQPSLPLQSVLGDLTRTLYEAGEVSFLSLLTAQRTYSQTHLNYLDAVRELRAASAEIEDLLLSIACRQNRVRPADRRPIAGHGKAQLKTAPSRYKTRNSGVLRFPLPANQAKKAETAPK